MDNFIKPGNCSYIHEFKDSEKLYIRGVEHYVGVYFGFSYIGIGYLS